MSCHEWPCLAVVAAAVAVGVVAVVVVDGVRHGHDFVSPHGSLRQETKVFGEFPTGHQELTQDHQLEKAQDGTERRELQKGFGEGMIHNHVPAALLKDLVGILEFGQIDEEIRFGSPDVDHVQRQEGGAEGRSPQDSHHKMSVLQERRGGGVAAAKQNPAQGRVGQRKEARGFSRKGHSLVDLPEFLESGTLVTRGDIAGLGSVPVHQLAIPQSQESQAPMARRQEASPGAGGEAAAAPSGSLHEIGSCPCSISKNFNEKLSTDIESVVVWRIRPSVHKRATERST